MRLTQQIPTFVLLIDSERKVKHDVVFHDNNTVTYKERRTMIFNRTMSTGSENDTFVTINIPLMVSSLTLSD